MKRKYIKRKNVLEVMKKQLIYPNLYCNYIIKVYLSFLLD